jgi:two-component system phosphate regulon sensor histidine kinase PhoR
VVAFTAGLCLACAALVWFGYVATREWRRGTDLLIERRSLETLAAVGAALNHDMKGAWATVLVPINQIAIEEEPPYDLRQLIATAFARFPYPESFIVWKDHGHADGLTYAFNRTERLPPWDKRPESSDPFPVVLVQDPPALRQALAVVRESASSGNAFALVETNIDGQPYQIVAHLLYARDSHHTLSGLAAFTVNRQWMREQYFAPLLHEVAKIGDEENAVSLAITDEHGQQVAVSGQPAAEGQDVQRQFAPTFVDTALLTPFHPPNRTAIPEWTVHVRPSRDNPLGSATEGARRTFELIVVAAGASMIALLLTIRAVQASATLASMKSDFVSAVTHELKTPLSLIRLVGDTLARGRYTSEDTVRDYARLLSQEATRLTHSIDNLLTYARYSDVRRHKPADLAPTDLGDLGENALEPFRPLLSELGFELIVDIPNNLPCVAADRTALVQAMENVIDNAIKYSGEHRVLKIVASAHREHVQVTFADRGIGIPREDVRHVFERFYRGSNAKESGSGLGLAIARRIVRFHGGDIGVRSTVDVGTEVDLQLLAANQS